MVNLVALQMNSTPDPQENLQWVASALQERSYGAGATTVVVLPECFASFGNNAKAQLALAERKGNGPIQEAMSSLAQQYRCYLVGGSVPLYYDDQHFTASCLVYAPTGECIAEYQKIHLFDAAVSDGTGQYKESAHTTPGSQVVTFAVPEGRVGVAICYDIRFPGLFAAMGDVDVLAIPAAFTRPTGQAHWHTLLRARAIENQCFVVAAGQTGVHHNGRETYGHSLIVSPWGEVLAEREESTGIVQSCVNLDERAQIKRNMPVRAHNKFRSHLV